MTSENLTMHNKVLAYLIEMKQALKRLQAIGFGFKTNQ